MARHTHTYAILEVARATYDDIVGRLTKAYGQKEWDAREKDEYLHEDREHGVVIVLGSVALAVDQRKTTESNQETPS